MVEGAIRLGRVAETGRLFGTSPPYAGPPPGGH